MDSGKKIVLLSSEGQEFEIDEAVALQSETIKIFIEDNVAESFPVPNVTGPILAMVLEYCKRHAAADAAAPDAVDVSKLKTFDEDFIKVDQLTLYNLIMAANYLNVKSLLDLACQTVADMIKGKTAEEIRKIFNIKNDFAPEEEDEIRKESDWASDS